MLTYGVMNLKKMILSERSQSQNSIYHVIPFIGNIDNFLENDCNSGWQIVSVGVGCVQHLREGCKYYKTDCVDGYLNCSFIIE